MTRQRGAADGVGQRAQIGGRDPPVRPAGCRLARRGPEALDGVPADPQQPMRVEPAHVVGQIGPGELVARQGVGFQAEADEAGVTGASPGPLSCTVIATRDGVWTAVGGAVTGLAAEPQAPTSSAVATTASRANRIETRVTQGIITHMRLRIALWVGSLLGAVVLLTGCGASASPSSTAASSTTPSASAAVRPAAKGFAWVTGVSPQGERDRAPGQLPSAAGAGRLEGRGVGAGAGSADGDLDTRA